jgi:MFS family permease
VLGVSASMSDAAFESWGWRLPFLLSLVMIVVGLYVRVRIEESPVFQELVDKQAQVRLPVAEVLRHNGKQVLLAMTAVVGNSALGYLFLTFLLSYGTGRLGMNRTSLLWVMLGGALVLAITMVGFSAWSDRVGRRPVFVLSYGLLTLWAIPFFPLVDTGSVGLVAVACAVLVLGLAASQGPTAALLAEMFPARVRASGVSLSYALGAVLGGGLAPFIATALYDATGTSLSVSIYMIVVCLISLFAVLAIRVPQHASLHDVAHPSEAVQVRS